MGKQLESSRLSFTGSQTLFYLLLCSAKMAE